MYRGQDRLARALEASWVLVAYGVGFIALINGIHGGLRDLPNDRKHRKHTLALWLGASEEEGGVVVSSPGVRWYAFVVQLVLAGLVVAVLWTEGFAARANARVGQYEDTVRLVVACLLCGLALVVSAYLLWRVVKDREPRRNFFVTRHLPVLLLPPIVLVCVASGPELVFKMVVTLSFVAPLLFRKEVLVPLAHWMYDDGGLRGMVQRVTMKRRVTASVPAPPRPAQRPERSAPPSVSPSEEAGE